jgi:hypothetical protein
MEKLIYIVIGLVLLVIAYFLIKYLLIGAISLFAWAVEQGFVGVAAYFACWFFLFPIMVVASIITGAATKWAK